MASTRGSNLRRLHVQKVRREVASASRMIEGYQRMLAVAKELQMESELARLPREIAEWEHERDELLEDAALSGLTYDEVFGG